MWRAFHRMLRVLDRGLERQLSEEAGISGADFEVLVPVSEAADQQLRARELVRILSWDRSRLSHHLRRMERRGLIRRSGREIAFTDWNEMRRVGEFQPGYLF